MYLMKHFRGTNITVNNKTFPDSQMRVTTNPLYVPETLIKDTDLLKSQYGKVILVMYATKLLIHSQISMVVLRIKDTWLYPTLYNGNNYLSTLGLKFINFSTVVPGGGGILQNGHRALMAYYGHSRVNTVHEVPVHIIVKYPKYVRTDPKLSASSVPVQLWHMWHIHWVVMYM